MYLYRVLSDADIAALPQLNGIFSKKAIYDKLKELLDIINDNYDEEIIDAVAKEFKAKFMPGICADIKREVLKEKKGIHCLLCPNSREEILRNSFFIAEITSTVTQHLRNGSRYDTPWISFSDNLDALKVYYKKQNKHQIAIINSNIVNYLDDGVFAFDLSSREKIINNNFLVKASDFYQRVNPYSPAYNNAIHSHEYIYYNYISKEQILYVMRSLFIDLYYNDMIDEEIFKDGNIYKLEKLLYDLLSSIMNNYSDANKKIINELYNNDIPIGSVSNSLNVSIGDLYKLREDVLNEFSKKDYCYKKELKKDIKFMD